MNIRKQFFIWLLFVWVLTAFTFPPGGKRMNHNRIVFAAEEAEKLSFLKNEAPFWTPTFDQIRELELLLLKYLEAHPPIDDQPVMNFNEYGRQYMGVTKNHRRLIYLNAFCDPSSFDERWKELIRVKDGGSCFFQVYFDPVKREFIDLQYNGQA